jgi:hypothetical protein
MISRIRAMLTKARPAPEPHFYPAEIEKHLRKLGLSPFAEELQR